MTRRPPAVLAPLLWWLCLAPSLTAQTTGSLEAGASYVDYEGFLPSAAFYLVPSVQYQRPGLSLGGQGSWVVFESGNSVLHGSGAAGVLKPIGGPLRAEVSGAAGLALYTAADRYGHLLLRGRLHASGREAGAWIGGVTGWSVTTGDAATPVELAVGGWSVRHTVTLGASATRTWFGDVRYLDLDGTLTVALRGFELRCRAGIRAWTSNVDEGPYGEVLVHVPVAGRYSVELSGGRYPTDPVRGILAASYASVGVRASTVARRRVEPDVEEALTRAYGEAPEGGRAIAAWFDVERRPDDTVRLRVHAQGASRVEIMGDFTDWVTVPLDPASAETFEITLPIPPGVHRLNVRIDGGTWLVPRGMRAERDDFGGAVGVFVVS